MKKDNKKKNHEIEKEKKLDLSKKNNFPKIMEKIKNICSKIISILRSGFEWLKNKFNSLTKRNKIIVICVLVAIIIIIWAICSYDKKDNKFALNDIYDIYPEEVKKIFYNMSEVSCTGDIHFDVEISKPATNATALNKKNLLDYVFSTLDKNEELTDKMDASIINNKQKELFATPVDLLADFKEYQYGEYLYTLKGDKITRKKNECKADIKYVDYLYGYSWNNNILSMDVNVAYLKDGILYDFADNKLGVYDGDASKLFGLTKLTSYYRINFIRDGDKYKLTSVEWKNRS